jgi:hypothetical protein
VKGKSLGAVLCAFAMAGCQQPSFSDEDIANLKSEITTNASAQGFTVQEIGLIRTDDRELSGFAKLSKDIDGYGIVNVTWSCSATMSRDDGQYVWKCAP